MTATPAPTETINPVTQPRIEELTRQREEAIAAAGRAVDNGNLPEELWWRGRVDKLSRDLDDLYR